MMTNSSLIDKLCHIEKPIHERDSECRYVASTKELINSLRQEA